MNPSQKFIVGLGEVLWDLFPDGARLGGAPANFSFHAAQLGTPSVLVSAVGKDDLAARTRRELEARGIDFLLHESDFPTGTVDVRLDANGAATYDIRTDAAWDHLSISPAMQQVAQSALAVCFGTLAQRTPTGQAAIRDFLAHTSPQCLRICDINLRAPHFSDASIESSIRQCNVLKVSTDEWPFITNLLHLETVSLSDAAHQLLQRFNLQMLILTCGAEGSHVFSPASHSYLPSLPVEVVDTVGAGDSFTGAFCAALLRGHSLHDAHTLAVEVSGHVCAHAGAMVEWPQHLRQ